MTNLSRRLFLGSSLVLAGCSEIAPGFSLGKAGFVCAPCGCANDGTVFDDPGRCSACGMTLEPNAVSDLGYEPSKLTPGAGHFQLGETIGRPNRPIRVDYHLPKDAGADANIVLILPGTGRGSSEYRNQWISHALGKNALVAALGYPEETYDFAQYHMGGAIESFDTGDMEVNQPSPNATVLSASDEAFDVSPNRDRSQWIFSDFDKVFEFLKAAAGLRSETYDLFGHSAGGQILHRMALLAKSDKVGQIIAANAGFYTLPDLETALPLGLGGVGLSEDDLVAAFGKNLTILLGEKDNGLDAGGTFLRTPTLDKQGLSRLERGQSFYSAAQDRAKALGSSFNWKLQTVPGVGHDSFGMAEAASELL